MNILMVLTSHDTLGATGRKTGLWLEEWAVPYFAFRDAGATVTLASPKGGRPPIDPASESAESQTEATRRFASDTQAMEAFANTRRLSEMRAEDYDAVFYPGGHGPLWDLAEDRSSIALIGAFHDQKKPVAAICHAPAVLRHVVLNGLPLVKDRRVTGFSNSEEEAVGLTGSVPFLLEDELKRLGGLYERKGDGESFVVTDGQLITGQNPASSAEAAAVMVKRLQAPSATVETATAPSLAVTPLAAARAT
jgi:putative intracellular protease/amidase